MEMFTFFGGEGIVWQYLFFRDIVWQYLFVFFIKLKFSSNHVVDCVQRRSECRGV